MPRRKAMRVFDKRTGAMECRVCGSTHQPRIKNGRFARGSWQCIRGCEIIPVFSKKIKLVGRA